MDTLEMESKIMQVLRQVYDPEIPVNIYDLGLVYEIRVEEDGRAFVTMTLTSPNCPVAESLPVEVKESVMMVPGVTSAEVTVTFDPPWNKDMMSEEAMLDLGLL